MIALLLLLFQDPAYSDPPILEKERNHWAFRNLANVKPPAGDAKNPIDRFIAARLKRGGLSPAPRADRKTLLRRLRINLTGLPLTSKELDAFLSDRSDDAYPKVVRRLLDSPGYGERWAQHWLDLVRFAESEGFGNDLVRKES